ncbi:GDNF family receptor alpha-4 isoform X1 [Cydia amplana]|uniref:GDNF family receptor alpha-4 isoform X1 n=1 Tax=Cydia amplana TaxID=1869771 RepID=UPI002FE69E83
MKTSDVWEEGEETAMRVMWVLLVVGMVGGVGGSEFPERECCDPVYPPNTATTAAAPVTVPVSKAAGPYIGEKGVPGVKAMAILNCLLARQLCFEDASCSAILEIIPRVCGSELVACSTVTVTKCQAALRTLQAFPFFKPTCLCREPNVDPECNSFRDFLFDHPCVFVMKKEKDPYPVETLPTCTYALSVCHNEKACSVLFDRFKNACKARDGECRMEDREACREAWAGLRLSPLFGCICPNTHMKKRCDRIFAVVNHNPCVERIGKENGKAGDDKVALQSTCHVALETCIKDNECSTTLDPVLQNCHATNCDREGCMAALRGFYRKPGVHWNTEIAFCLCKKTVNKEDSCMRAQEQLHPSCAQRPPSGQPLPACHTLAHACREEPECR